MRRIAVLIALFVLSGTTYSATLYVPDDYPIIQDAIQAAVNGDTVIVRPGTYVENTNFLGKAITVKSDQGPEVTVIDAGNLGRGVTFANGEGNNSVLEGFKITQGYVKYGGGVYCSDASPTIRNNIILDNLAMKFPLYGDGGGLYCENGSPVIQDNIFEDNYAWCNGGAIYCTTGTPVISGNTFLSNEANTAGGAIWCDTALAFENNVFKNNVALNGNGGGICCMTDGVTVLSSTFTNNDAPGDFGAGGGVACGPAALIEGNVIKGGYAAGGGGIYCGAGSTVINNTITNNTAGTLNPWFGNEGGGLWCEASLSIINNTFSKNHAVNDGGAVSCGNDSEIINSILWEDTSYYGNYEIAGPGGVYVNHCDVWGGWPGTNINKDPLFVGGEDYHLTWTSPCINRGIQEGAPGVDVDGDPRPHMGTVDMGSDEYNNHIPLHAEAFSFSEATGGTVVFTLTGPGGGDRNYMMLGSVSGTISGTPMPGWMTTLPINWDAFTNLVWGNLNSVFFQHFMGILDISHVATAVFDTMGPVPGGAGITLSFAYTLNGPFDFVSNPINIEITP